MPSVIVGIGPPGSGKTTLLGQLMSANCLYVSTDDIRERFTGDAADQSQNPAVWDEVYRLIRQALASGRDVVLDATSAKAENRLELIARCRPLATQIIGVWFKTPLETCLERNQRRERVVSEHLIRAMHQTLSEQPPSLQEGFTQIIEVEC